MGYYVVDYSPDYGLLKTPITSFVFYFENSQSDYETISTNYLTINDSGFNTCSRIVSNYNYVMHPDGLIYPVNNTINWLPMTEDKFISMKKLDYIQNIDSKFVEEYNYYNNTYTVDDTYDNKTYDNNTYTVDNTYDIDSDKYYTTSAEDINLNYNYQNEYKENTYDYVNRRWGEFNDDKTEKDLLDLPSYQNFNYNDEIPSHISFTDKNKVLNFTNQEEAGKYCYKNYYSTLNNNININGQLYNCSCYKDYVYFYSDNSEPKTFKYP